MINNILKKIQKLVGLVTILFFLSVPLHSQISNVYINEILASNVSSSLSPGYSEYADWIELYNAGSSQVNIGGTYLTDDASNPFKYKIPVNTTIAAGGYKIFWADGYNETIHTNFELSRDGEFIGLFNSNGSKIDSFSFKIQQNDISYGRLKNNLASFGYFTSKTPGAANSLTSYPGIVETPIFLLKGGLYTGSQNVGLSGTPSAQIRYTLDGTIPTSSSTLYSSPINITSTKAVRISAFETGKLPSEVVTQTYLINENIHLPVVSLVTDPDNFFDDEIGIYVTGTNGTSGTCDGTIRNLNQDWERPVNVEFYELTGEQRLNQEAGVKIFGGCSRTRFPQKSLILYARNQYGKGSFEYQLFKDKPIFKFESFVLRSAADDQVRTMFRDALAQLIARQNMDADIQDYRPAVMFLNGQYWGIHNIREKINEHYPEENYQVKPENVSLLERNGNVIYGSADDYFDMLDYVQSHNMAINSYYDYVATQMDIKQYIDYEIAHIYFAERDWPGNNIKFWKANSGIYNKWRWICLDMDQSIATWRMDENSLEVATMAGGGGWPNPDWSTLLLRNLLKNQNFKNYFVQKLSLLLSTTFTQANMDFMIDSIKQLIAAEIPRHITKWGGQLDPDCAEGWPDTTFSSYAEWEENVNDMHNFAAQRPGIFIPFLTSFFNLSSLSKLTVTSNINNAGIIRIMDTRVPAFNFSADFYKNIPIKIKATPKMGYHFSRWVFTPSGQSPVEYTDPEINITITGISTLTAYFEQAAIFEPVVIINEINYHSADYKNTGDWVELYNRGNDPVDLSGWVIKDKSEENIFIFPDGTEIKANGYLVIVEDDILFDAAYPEVHNRTGMLGYGIANGGEVIRLYSPENELIDSVHFEDTSPWPLAPDGFGATLELINYDLNNDLAENWKECYNYGTPGTKNSMITFESPISLTQFPSGYLGQNYPNPFGLTSGINYYVIEPGFVSIEIYDIYGRIIKSFVNQNQITDQYMFELNANEFENGVYFYSLYIDNKLIGTRRMVVIR